MTSSDISLAGRILSSRSHFSEVCFMKHMAYVLPVEFYEVHLVGYNKAHIWALQ
jgi:hypothetical protein